jgi:DNA segregation ATPase FtsK/SpoIIIE-like protein
MSATRSLLRQVRLRLVVRSAVEDAQLGAAVGGAVALSTLAVQRFLAPGIDPLWTACAGLAAGAAVPVAGYFLRRRSEAAVAAAADAGLGLRERISTAMWCASAPAGGLAALVPADADAAAARVPASAVGAAFRPSVRRRPLAAAAVAFAGIAGLLLWQPSADATVETASEKAQRLADQNRVAEVAKKLREYAKQIEDHAKEKKRPDVEATAKAVKLQAERMQREPPTREVALQDIAKMADQVQEAMKQRAAMQSPDTAKEKAEQDKEFSELLKNLSDANLESLQRDLKDLAKRMESEASGGTRPSAEEMRDLANRLDALRRAQERAENDRAGSKDLAKRLRTAGEEEKLRKISEKLRELAAKADSGGGYEGLQGEESEELSDLSEMSEEELQQLLEDLESMADMEDLRSALQQGSSEARGGRRMRLPPRPGGT